MPTTVDILIPSNRIEDTAFIRREAFNQAGIKDDPSWTFVLRKRSIDARCGQPKFRLRIELIEPGTTSDIAFEPNAQDVSNAREIHIIGSGPAGLFSAIRAIERGLKPIIIERGKDVRERRRDLALLNKEHIVNPESNYCFGEGGAGTYSDGKLYTRSKKRGSVDEILNYLIFFGADPEIKIEAHPHIGTNRLPKIIERIRAFILECGGEIHFNTKLTALRISNDQIHQIELNGNEWINCEQLVLATGHSARDIFRMLHSSGIRIEAKPFALGARIGHPQELIDQIQWRCETRPNELPPASYNLVQQVNGIGVYSFCMCPGGIIAPCATAEGEIVTNGWSPSKRNNPFANSGIVVEVRPEHFAVKGDSPLAAMEYQAEIEQKAWARGGQRQSAPAQRMTDFVAGRISQDLPKTSYQPGIVSSEMDGILPTHVAFGLRMAFPEFGKKMHGYFTEEAVLHAVESRTSSPVRIPRDRESFQHPEVKGFFPCGEGAGYAGGILSAAMDGFKVADRL